MTQRTYSSKTLALVCATIIFLFTLTSNTLVFGFTVGFESLDNHFVWVCLVVAVVFAIIGYYVLGRRIKFAVYRQLTHLFNNMVPENPYVPKEETIGMEDLIAQVQDVVAKRKLEMNGFLLVSRGTKSPVIRGEAFTTNSERPLNIVLSLEKRGATQSGQLCHPKLDL